MSARIWRDLLILIGVFCAVWMAFSHLPIFPEETDFSISVEKEKEIGDKLIENLLSTRGEDSIANPTVDLFVDSVFQVLNKSLEDSEFEYTFIVLDNNQINAFAMPGGYIMVYSGLIEFCDTPEEFAGVIAHEIGHIENRHLISRLLKRLGVAVLLSGDASVLGEVGQMAVNNVFDRDQEKEADYFAFELLEKSGISPRVVSTFFRKLEEEGHTYNEDLEILMTHPHHNQRIKAALEYKMDSNFVASKLPFDLAKVKDALRQTK